jgi:hypothetical protein
METKLREVTIEEYWTSIVKGTAEFGEIAVAENPEFNNLAKCIYQALCDGFIDKDMSEYGVSRWEHILGITPVAGSSLDDRKAAILTHLSVKIPYTWRVLKQMLIPIIGSEDKFEMSLNNEMGELDIKFKIPVSETPIEAIEQLMERVLPMNLVPVYDYDIETLIPILNDGLSEMLAEGQFVLEYISDEKKVVVHTDRVDELTVAAVENLLGRVLPQNIEVARYNHHMEVSWRDINKYAECTNKADMLAVNPDYQNDVTSDGTWVYPLPNLATRIDSSNAPAPFYNMKTLRRFDERVTFNNLIYSGFIYNATWALFCGSNLEEIPRTWTFSKAQNMSCVFQNTKVQLIPSSIKLKELTAGLQMFQNTPMRHIEDDLELVRLSGGDNMFSGCQLDAESVPRVLNSLPFVSKAANIGLGIHVDHENDETVLAARTNAEAKGWNVKVQWNGTPTNGASTFGMRLIYARVNEYELPDGTTERVLDWGHYVTNPEEYETFRSLESAYRYFNLEMPENE